MLHPVPDSTLRARLLRVVVLQRRLIDELCQLPPGAAVDLRWLQDVWCGIETDWVRRFWENDKPRGSQQGNRELWITRIAAASAAEKRMISECAAEQVRFRELWATAPGVRMTKQNWKAEPLASLRKLLVSFYSPILYDDEGYEFHQAEFSKSDFIDGFPKTSRKVCPYCDNYLQTPELDHFLPKDDFPFLSCHPDNLIPSCHDSNSFSHKGTTVPLDWELQDQAANWFHPRWRSAHGLFSVAIAENANRSLTATLIPSNPAFASRVTNLNDTFKLSSFWSEQIEDELQLVGSQVSDSLFEANITPTEAVVRSKLQELAHLKDLEIGKRGLALCHHALYQFAATTPAVVTEITAACIRDRKNRLATRS